MESQKRRVITIDGEYGRMSIDLCKFLE